MRSAWGTASQKARGSAASRSLKRAAGKTLARRTGIAYKATHAGWGGNQVKTSALLSPPLSEVTGQLPRPLTKKRRVIEGKYKDKIDAMYPKDDV